MYIILCILLYTYIMCIYINKNTRLIIIIISLPISHTDELSDTNEEQGMIIIRAVINIPLILCIFV